MILTSHDNYVRSGPELMRERRHQRPFSDATNYLAEWKNEVVIQSAIHFGGNRLKDNFSNLKEVFVFHSLSIHESLAEKCN